MSGDRRSRLAASARANRREFWVQVLVGTVVAFSLILLGFGFVGLSPLSSGLLALLVVGAVGVWLRNRRTGVSPDQVDRTVPLNGVDSDGVRLTNFAFSEAAPNWSGWHRDVGDVTVHAERIMVDGLQNRLVLYPPFRAQLHDSRYFYWAMVKVTATTDSGDPVTVYLAGMGGSRSKFAARPEEVRNSGVALISVINRTQAG